MRCENHALSAEASLAAVAVVVPPVSPASCNSLSGPPPVAARDHFADQQRPDKIRERICLSSPGPAEALGARSKE